MSVIASITDMNLFAIDMNLLAVLDAVLTERTVTAAARRLGLTQPAVSNALGRLRERLHDPLVVPTRSGMVPTEYARRVAPVLRAALRDIETVLDPEAPFEASSAERTFTLAATDHVELVVLPSLVARLRREAPGITLRIRAWPQDPGALARGELDFVLARRDQVPGSTRAAPLFDDRLVCLARKDHPQIRGRLTMSTYLSLAHVLVSPREATGPGAVDAALAARGHERRVALRVPHFAAVPPIVASSDLVAAFSERLTSSFASSLPLRTWPLPIVVPRTRVSILWHERTNASPAHRWMRELLREVTTG